MSSEDDLGSSAKIADTNIDDKTDTRDKTTKSKQNTGDNDSSASDLEGNSGKTIRYPRAIPFIVGNEFCERFNFYGMRAILALYLVQKLGYTEDGATVVFHIFTTSYYFLCIIGAIIADSWWGKFKTILILSFVYIAGNFTITAGAIPQWELPGRTFTFIGLTLVAIGAGGIKSCVAAFGGDQFKLPEQIEQLSRFFSIFYFSINLGSFISSLITPILRDDVNCFGEDDCFSLGFFVPATLMIASVIIFIIGKPLYVMKGLQGNMLVRVSGCISEAVSQRFKNKDTTKTHWLDYAEKKYGRQLVNETKVLLNVLVLYIPLPFFWALFDQQGSRWTFQATRMDGNIGFYDLKPDQAQILNPLLILLFIPLYEVAIYPLLNLIGVRRPLQKLTLGMIMAALAFLISATLESQLMKTYAEIPKPFESHLRIYNSVPCRWNVRMGNDVIDLDVNGFTGNLKFDIGEGKNQSLQYTMVSNNNCPTLNGAFELVSGQAVGYFLRGNIGDPKFYRFIDSPDKTKRGDPKVKVLTNFQRKRTVKLVGDGTYEAENETESSLEVSKGFYDVFIDNSLVQTVELRQGAVYALLTSDELSLKAESVQVTQPNTVNILWIIPQYVVITLGEVMFSVTGIQFSYAEAPDSMKSVLNGCWQLTSAFGNLIIVIIAELRLFDEQIWEFILFACIMFVDTVVFAILAWRYKSIILSSDEQKDEANELDGTIKLPAIVNKQE